MASSTKNPALSSVRSSTKTVRTLAKIWKATDVEVHVRLADIDGLQFIEIMDYVPSIKSYGRGTYIPARPDFIDEIITALSSAAESIRT